MDNRKWPWFISGLAAGLILGMGTVGGYCWLEFQDERARVEEAEVKAMNSAMKAAEWETRGRLAERAARGELRKVKEEVVKFLKDVEERNP